MRKNVKEIQIAKEEITYIANDGTEFKTEEECRKYEDTADCAIRSAFSRIVQKESPVCFVMDDALGFAYDGTLRTITVHNADDVEIVNKWIINIVGEKPGTAICIGTESIGKTLVFEEYEGWIVNWGTIEEMVEDYRNALIKHLTTANETQEEKS